MTDTMIIKFAKLLSLLGFLVLLSSTYYLRREVLALNHIRFSSDEARARHELAQMQESYPERTKHYEIELDNFQLRQKHYQEMLDLYKSDYESYVKRIEDKYEPPQLPIPPSKPTPPELSKKLFEVNTEFRARKNQYFATSAVLNWFAWIAALALAGGLLFLILFDTNSNRWFYVIALSLSFVFMIGPSFHSILTSIIGFLEPPPVY